MVNVIVQSEKVSRFFPDSACYYNQKKICLRNPPITLVLWMSLEWKTGKEARAGELEIQVKP